MPREIGVTDLSRAPYLQYNMMYAENPWQRTATKLAPARNIREVPERPRKQITTSSLKGPTNIRRTQSRLYMTQAQLAPYHENSTAGSRDDPMS